MTAEAPEESLIEFAFKEPKHQVVDLSPDQLNALGGQLYLTADFPRAEAAFLAVLQADPEHAQAWANLGLVRQQGGFFEDAMKCYLNAHALNSNSAANLSNIAYLHDMEGRPDHAIRCYERALEIDPTNAIAGSSLGADYLKKFRFKEGWALLDKYRFSTIPPLSIDRQYSDVPRWDGSKCGRLLVWQEQGVGDQILYSTLIPDLMFSPNGPRELVWEVEARLIPALVRAFPTVTFTADPSTSIDGCDAHVPMMTLAGMLRPNCESFISQPHRMLRADPARAEAMALAIFPPRKWQRRVAISWRSFHGPFNIAKQRQKSAMLSDFDLLGFRDDLQIVTVQYGDVADEIAAWESGNLHVTGLDLFNDIDGVLAVLDGCDAVITTSNVTAHFAGALGKKTYLLVKGDVAPFFYWQPGPDPFFGRSLWYPSVRIVTGPTWKEAVESAFQQLNA